jgi:hypothetical protein
LTLWQGLRIIPRPHWDSAHDALRVFAFMDGGVSMGISCIAALMVLLETPAASAVGGVLVGYEVRVVEMKGLDWRGRAHAELRPIERQHGASVWIAPRAAVSKILAEASRVVYTPKPATGRDVPADIRTTLCYPYVAHLERRADGPVGKATAVGYLPHIDQVEESLNVGVRCRKVDGGVQTQVNLEETRLAMLTTYEIHEMVQPSEPSSKAEPTHIKAPIQVPEIIHGEVQGDWRVPFDHVLVIGLGIHTTQDKKGKSSLLERVAIIEPKPEQTLPTEEHKLPPSEAPMAAMSRFPSAELPYRDPEARAAAFPAGALPPLPIAESGRWAEQLHTESVPLSSVHSPSFTETFPGSISSSSPLVVASQNGGPLVLIVPVGGPVNVAPAQTFAHAAAHHVLPTVPAAPVALRTPAEPLGTPIIPDRSLPTPRNALGQVVPLPPLPEPEPEVVDPSAEPRGSAQDRHVKPAPAGDTRDSETPATHDDADHHANRGQTPSAGSLRIEVAAQEECAAGTCCAGAVRGECQAGRQILTDLGREGLVGLAEIVDPACASGQKRKDPSVSRSSSTVDLSGGHENKSHHAERALATKQVPAALCAAASSPTLLPPVCDAGEASPAKLGGRITLGLSSSPLPTAKRTGKTKALWVPLAPFVYLGIELGPKSGQ